MLTPKFCFLQILFGCERFRIHFADDIFNDEIIWIKVERHYNVVQYNNPDSKVHVAHMGPTWVLSTPGRPHMGPMNLAIREGITYIIAETEAECQAEAEYTKDTPYPNGWAM